MIHTQTTFAQSFTSSHRSKNITYKVVNNTDSIKLDIYAPTKKVYDKNPVIVFIHGGAWAKGDKDLSKSYYFTNLKDTLQTKGYAVVSINYRLVNESIHIADQLTDCQDALKWVAEHAKTYNFDENNIGVWGESAGAHLALLVGYGVHNASKDLPEIQYIIDNFGPTDLNKVLKTNASWFTRNVYKMILPDLYNLRGKLIKALTSYEINTHKKEAMAIAKNYSLITYVATATKTPTLLLHGTKDFIVPIKESKKLHKKLNETLITNSFIKVKKGHHGFTTIPNSEIQDLIKQTYLFMQQHYHTQIDS
ncbi:MAG TPA: alpha/beta hydrolase [Flavobacterium sp.]|nr:alpha/beta hydrolase [Flavobacterium sp.]